MIQLTVQELTQREYFPEAIDCCLYLVRDGETVFYIGQSASPIDRLQSHLGNDWRAEKSDLGELIASNGSEALTWSVELYTLADAGQTRQAYRYVSFRAGVILVMRHCREEVEG